MNSDHRLLQLRKAKQAQRERDRKAGLVLYQTKLPAELAERLKAGLRNPDFSDTLADFLKEELVEINVYPQLKTLCWNMQCTYLTKKEVFNLYERNWRFIDRDSLNADEETLIHKLTEELGAGVINA